MKAKPIEKLAAVLWVGIWTLGGCEAVDNGDNGTDYLISLEDSSQTDNFPQPPVDDVEDSDNPPVDLSFTRVRMDEGHFNFHKLSTTFAPFGELLANAGFDVAAINAVFTADSLANVDILVIVNALNEADVEDWDQPTSSAFSNDEIAAVNTWVASGGALFLIADHMPMGGAAAALAASFGFGFNDGFLVSASNRNCVKRSFSFDNGNLQHHPIVDGADETEAVDFVMSFCGQGFTIPPESSPLLVLDEYAIVIFPEISWTWDEETPAITAENMVQGATMPYGDGRVAAFGEASMFTCKAENSGMCNPDAPQNKQFLLNVAHWLDEML